MNIFNLLANAARRYPQSGAVYQGEEQRLTFEALLDRALRLSAALRTQGKAGDRVLIASKNRVEMVEIMFGIWAAGMIAVPLNAKLHPREMADIAQDCVPILTFASEPLTDELASLAIPGKIVGIGGDAYASMLDTGSELPVDTAPDDVAWLFYTSGTTGPSKGAMLTHRNLLAMSIAHHADFDAVEVGSSLIHAAPMSHGSGLYMLPYIAGAARQVIPSSDGFDAAEFLKLCSVHPRAAAFLAPTMVQRCTLFAEESGVRPANLHLIIYGGGPMYVSELRRALATFGPVFAQLYGQGESPMTITGLRRADHATDDEAILGSVGWPRSGVEVAIFDEDDRPLPLGADGEIVCRGDVVMAGYWNRPEATAETLRGGWLHTGDIGSLDDRGCLTLRDRSKDVIISGGTNIYPREVEEVLLIHPAVAEVAVVGEADAEWGEIVCAYVVAKPDFEVTADDLDAHCLARIARFKRPKKYHFLTELPKSNYGKVLKRALVANGGPV